MTLNLDFANCTKNLVSEETMQYLKKRSGNIILFGAGKSGDYFHSLLNSYDIKAVCYCDNSSQKQGTIKNGLLIYSCDEALSKWPEATICITSCYSSEIESQLTGRKDVLSVMNTCSWETTDKSLESKEVDYIRAHEDELNIIYSNTLHDDKSRAVMQGILNYRLTRNSAYIKCIAEDTGEYFDEKIIQKKSDINFFIDGGAWTGDTLDAFIKWKNCVYSHIYCFEAENGTSQVLQSHIDAHSYKNVTVFNNALWDKKQRIDFFNSNGTGGGYCLCDNKSVSSVYSIEGVRADDIISTPVDMIKLDIEGAEANALLGMQNLIRKYKPVLAVCIYHKQDDFITLPKLVLDLVPEYKIYFRQYFLTPFSTVMYAVI